MSFDKKREVEHVLQVVALKKELSEAKLENSVLRDCLHSASSELDKLEKFSRCTHRMIRDLNWYKNQTGMTPPEGDL